MPPFCARRFVTLTSCVVAQSTSVVTSEVIIANDTRDLYNDHSNNFIINNGLVEATIGHEAIKCSGGEHWFRRSQR
jgi:hypothetical protein